MHVDVRYVPICIIFFINSITAFRKTFHNKNVLPSPFKVLHEILLPNFFNNNFNKKKQAHNGIKEEFEGILIFSYMKVHILIYSTLVSSFAKCLHTRWMSLKMIRMTDIHVLSRDIRNGILVSFHWWIYTAHRILHVYLYLYLFTAYVYAKTIIIHSCIDFGFIYCARTSISFKCSLDIY